MDERRRRRLAQEVDQETPAERRNPPRAPSAHSTPPKEPRPPFIPASPVESVIRPQLWVSVLFTLLALTAWAGILALGDWIDGTHAALSAAFGLQDGLLVRSLRAGCLFFAAQVSYVILWHRIRSRKDFSGRYKVWAWVVPTWLVFAFAAATDAHWLAGRAVEARWPLNVRDTAALCWFVPAAAVLLALTRLLGLEMRKCRVSVWCLRLAMLSAAVAGAVVLGGHLFSDARTMVLVGSVSSTLWPVGLLISFWYYARHVIHVTNEPAELPTSATQRAGRLSKLRRWWSEWSAARTERQAARKPAPKADAEMYTTPRVARVDSPASPAKAEAPRAAAPPVAPPRAAPVPPARTSPAPPARPAPDLRTADRSPVARPTFDSSEDLEDDAEDESWSEGTGELSKKERKRLRKLQRQRQRAL